MIDNILYGIFLIAEFGLPAATVVFIIFCIIKGEISVASLKASGLVLLWIAGGVLFCSIVCVAMSANSEKAERVCFLLYCIISALIYRLCRKEKEGRD